MKANRLWIFLFVLLFLVVRLPAQQSETNRSSRSHSLASDQTIQPTPSGNATNASATNSEAVANWVLNLAGLRAEAEKGDATAQVELGQILIGTDPTEAAKWCRRAAEQGNAVAQRGLGLCYDVGQGVPQDYIEAYKWLNLAAVQGDEDARTSREALSSVMTPDQIAEAQRLAREFKPRREGSANYTSPANPTAGGSGFFITDDGYLISNYHLVKDAAQVRLVTSAGSISAKVVQVDAADDLALLKADGQFAALPIISSRTVKLGGTVATVGFPDPGLQGFAPKLARGEIAALSGAGDDERYFQISASCEPGNSGGALVDAEGNVVGIVSAKLDAGAALAASGVPHGGRNYAVKSSFLLSFLESVPDVANKLKAPNTKEEKFEDVVKSAQDAAVLVLAY
jgi:S1-C subfamily serine protease